MNTLLVWTLFHIFILALLAFDLGLLQRGPNGMSVRGALWASLGYIVLALLFGAGVFYFRGTQAGYEFLTGYFIEKSLSVDNIFVFLLIFLHFSVPKASQRKVLLWGVLGALVMRAVLIGVGASAIATFHWLLYVFGLILVASGIKMLVTINQEPDMSGNRIVRFMRRNFRVTEEFEGDKFWVRRDGLLFMTPLFMVLVVVETSDVIFALDSIPAILAISTDTFIVYSSNVFAILGLRALYFALAGVIHRFHYLKYGLSLVLILVGVKMLVNTFFDGKIISTETALLATAAIIGGSMLYSVYRTRQATADEARAATHWWIPGSPARTEDGARPEENSGPR
ncbi:MAG: TerC family protein [Deltaproteobacteria bacterium]|nr:TerC family protein [Deltaproteobacteria bacterium]